MVQKKSETKRAGVAGSAASSRRVDTAKAAGGVGSGRDGARANGQTKVRAKTMHQDRTKESEEISKANELLLRVWEKVYATRGRRLC